MAVHLASYYSNSPVRSRASVSHAAWRSSGADLDDSGAKFFDLVEAETVDGFELGQVLWSGEDNVAESGRGENEKKWEAEAFGFGFAPVAETLVESLLLEG